MQTKRGRRGGGHGPSTRPHPTPPALTTTTTLGVGPLTSRCTVPNRWLYMAASPQGAGSAATRLPWCASRGAGRKSAPSPWGPRSPRSRPARAARRRRLRRPPPAAPPAFAVSAPSPPGSTAQARALTRRPRQRPSGGKNHHRPALHSRRFYKWQDAFTRTAFETQQVSWRVGSTAGAVFT